MFDMCFGVAILSVATLILLAVAIAAADVVVGISRKDNLP